MVKWEKKKRGRRIEENVARERERKSLHREEKGYGDSFRGLKDIYRGIKWEGKYDIRKHE